MLKPVVPTGGELVQVAEASWTDVFQFDVAADLYEVQVTATPGSVSSRPLPDGSYLRNCGWFGFDSLQGYVRAGVLSYSHQAIPVSGILATGLLIYTKTGTAGTVRAFKRQ
jgi:hypothetical protein